MNNHWLRLTLTVCLVTASSTPVRSQMGGHGSHPLMPDQRLVVRVRFNDKGESRSAETELELPMTGAPADVNQTLALPSPLPAVRVTRYLPRAELNQEVEPGNHRSARPAILLSVDGAKQHYKRWLLADDPERNRLVSFIATWRYMAVDDRTQRDALLSQFERELTRDPVVSVTGPDGKQHAQSTVERGVVLDLRELGCKMRIKDFFPDFAIDDDTGKPVNRSDRRLNPAVLVEVDLHGKRLERWLFAKFPDFKMQDDPELPFHARLDCPLEKRGTAPDFALVTIRPDSHEMWIRHQNQTVVRPLTVNDPVAVPEARYTFHVERYIPSGVLKERYVPTDGRGGVPAIRLEYIDETGAAAEVWLELGKERSLPLANGQLAVAFDQKRANPSGTHR